MMGCLSWIRASVSSLVEYCTTYWVPAGLPLAYQSTVIAPVETAVRALEKGGMGKVVAAYDPELDRKVAIKLLRPELTVFTVMGDGDCVSIGAGHWIHAVRYNVNITALLLDNNIYGLTKMQTSPTTPKGVKSNTQPQGSWLPQMNPLEATLGVTNASFVAQTAEWIPSHLFATLKAAYKHKGFSFVRILQRCPAYLPKLFEEAVTDPDRIEMLVHPDGVEVPELAGTYKDRVVHDPSDIDAARRYAEDQSVVRLGVYFRDESRPRYEETRHLPTLTAEEKLNVLEEEFDRYAV